MDELLDLKMLAQEWGNFLIIVGRFFFVKDLLQNFDEELLVLPFDLILVDLNAIYWSKLSHTQLNCFILIEKRIFSYVVTSISDSLVNQFCLYLELVNENHDAPLGSLKVIMSLK